MTDSHQHAPLRGGLQDLKRLSDLHRKRQQVTRRAAVKRAEDAPVARKQSAGESPAAGISAGGSVVDDRAQTRRAGSSVGAYDQAPSAQGEQGQIPSSPVLSEADRRLFRASVRGIRPIAASQRVTHGAQRHDQQSARQQRNARYYEQKRAQAEGLGLLAPERPRSRHRPQALDHTAAAHTKSHHQITSGVAANRGRPVARLNLSDEDQAVFLRHADAGDVLRRLRQGQWPIEATLDLHGATLEQAGQRFDRFINSCLQYNARCVCIIHGQGHCSPNHEPVLKASVRRWLRDHHAVMAYIPTPESAGGDGAVMVLFEKNKK